MKAGIMEIGDILVVNKCDSPRSDKIKSELKILQQISDAEATEEPIIKIVAPRSIGIPELYKAIVDKQKLQQDNNVLNRRHRARIKNEIVNNLQQSIVSHTKNNIVSDQEIEVLIDDVFDNKYDSLTVSLSMIKKS